MNEDGSDTVDYQKEQVLMLMGLTDEEITKDVERYEKTGKKAARPCHVCKRREGEMSGAYDVDKKEIRLIEIRLRRIPRQAGAFTFVFSVCQECYVLLGFHEDKNTNSKGVFIPVSWD